MYNAGYSYKRRDGVPRRFKTQALPPDPEVSEEDCAAAFVLSAEHLLDMLTKHDKGQVSKRTLEVFTRAVQTEFAFAPPSPEQIRRLA